MKAKRICVSNLIEILTPMHKDGEGMNTDPDGGWNASILFEALKIKDFDHESARMVTDPDGL
ncbi:MAG: hypothetical protein ABL994_20190 [Verrucomicrobiales bacterium]